MAYRALMLRASANSSFIAGSRAATRRSFMQGRSLALKESSHSMSPNFISILANTLRN